ncbi:hypothetical protein M0813_02950 [Anaeramoeba flamelloides]|uniref:Uncharacterized protein n=1 Tax=Anaeramoeba flamelloides TaxID=1746091 RepID=A0ABQ8YER9_9EUKA|nr:hypothetical protein M0813_02950 [Anaeramoeba flamelloides]
MIASNCNLRPFTVYLGTNFVEDIGPEKKLSNFYESTTPQDIKKLKDKLKKTKKKAPRGARTRDIQVKSLTLCRLS